MTQELTTINFEYNLDLLQGIADQALKIDKSDIQSVKEKSKELVKIRGIIQKKGKEYRDESNAFNKRVLEKEKEFVGVIEPVEIELKSIIAKYEENLVIEARKELLPIKKQQLELLDTLPTIEDNFILSLDESQWTSFYAQKMTEHKLNQDRETQRIADEVNRAEREAQIAKEAQEKAKRDFEELQARKEKEEFDRKEREAREAEKAKAQLESDAKYQQFLLENNFNDVTDRIVEKDGVVRIYRLVAEFQK